MRDTAKPLHQATPQIFNHLLRNGTAVVVMERDVNVVFVHRNLAQVNIVSCRNLRKVFA
jgi:hypothetical protein